MFTVQNLLMVTLKELARKCDVQVRCSGSDGFFCNTHSLSSTSLVVSTTIAITVSLSLSLEVLIQYPPFYFGCLEISVP